MIVSGTALEAAAGSADRRFAQGRGSTAENIASFYLEQDAGRNSQDLWIGVPRSSSRPPCC